MKELKEILIYNVMDEKLDNFYKKPSIEKFNDYVKTLVWAVKNDLYDFDEDCLVGDMAIIIELEEIL